MQWYIVYLFILFFVNFNNPGERISEMSHICMLDVYL